MLKIKEIKQLSLMGVFLCFVLFFCLFISIRQVHDLCMTRVTSYSVEVSRVTLVKES